MTGARCNRRGFSAEKQVLLPLPRKRPGHRPGLLRDPSKRIDPEAPGECRAAPPSAAGGGNSEAGLAQRSKSARGRRPPQRFSGTARGPRSGSSPSAPATPNAQNRYLPHRARKYGRLEPSHFCNAVALVFRYFSRKNPNWRDSNSRSPSFKEI